MEWRPSRDDRHESSGSEQKEWARDRETYLVNKQRTKQNRVAKLQNESDDTIHKPPANDCMAISRRVQLRCSLRAQRFPSE